MNLNITDRQKTILTIALTVLYDEIEKTGEGRQIKQDVMELSRMIADLKDTP